MSLQAISVSPQAQPADKLLVLLHGWGANAQDVAGLAPYLKLHNYQMLFPQGPFPHPMAPGGRMWYSLPLNYDFRQPHNFEQQADLQESRQRLRDWLLSLPDHTGIPLEQTILGGFSQGGAMTLDIGLQLPLAGLLILSGYNHAPLTLASPPRPVLLIHGRQDLVVPLPKAHHVKAELLAANMTVTYQEFEMGHEISLPAIEVAGQFCKDVFR